MFGVGLLELPLPSTGELGEGVEDGTEASDERLSLTRRGRVCALALEICVDMATNANNRRIDVDLTKRRRRSNLLEWEQK